MNDQIRKLAEQAGSTHKQNLGVYQFYTDELEKFAELIVRECSDVAHKCILEDGSDFPMKSVAYRIKEHFGVES